MKITTKILSSLSMILFFSFLVFSLSSKAPDVYEPDVPCEDRINGVTRKIKITFDRDANPNPFRKEDFIAYVPTPDLINSDFPGATSFGDGISSFSPEVQNYYASVTITSPQCDKWEWKRVFDTSNGNSNGEMTVQIPDNGAYGVRIQVKYYERIDGIFGTPDFNEDVTNSCGAALNTRVLHTADKLFVSEWGSSTESIMMIPTSNNPLACIDISSKYSAMADYNSVNEFIDINNLNPK